MTVIIQSPFCQHTVNNNNNNNTFNNKSMLAACKIKLSEYIKSYHDDVINLLTNKQSEILQVPL